MTITFRGFKLVPGLNAKDRFDLTRTKVITVKSDKLIGKKRKDGRKIGDTYEADEFMGYDLYLESAIQKIIMTILAEKEDVLELREYLKEYKKMKDEILNLLK